MEKMTMDLCLLEVGVPHPLITGKDGFTMFEANEDYAVNSIIKMKGQKYRIDYISFKFPAQREFPLTMCLTIVKTD